MLEVPAAPGPRHGTSDTVNTNVIGHAGAAWALIEAGSTPVRLNETLEVQIYDDFGGTLKGAFTAHPRRDPMTGELHAICYNATEPNEIRHVVVSAEGRVTREIAIPVQHGPSIHDCQITDRFVIVLDLPVTFSMAALIGGHTFPFAGTNRIRPELVCCRATAARKTSYGARLTRATSSTRQMPSMVPMVAS